MDSSPQAPRADHVSPTGATMRKIEPDRPMRRQAPTHQPQLLSSTTTHTVTTSYPRNVPQQYSHQSDNHHNMQSNPQIVEPNPAFDRRLDGPYPRGNERTQGASGVYDGMPDRNQRQLQYPRGSGRTQGLSSVNDDTPYRNQRQGLDNATDGIIGRKQRQNVNGVTTGTPERNYGQGVGSGTDGYVGRKNSIPRKAIDTKISPSHPLPKAPQVFPAESTSAISKQQKDFGPRTDSTGAPTTEQVLAGAKSNTYDTLVAEKSAPGRL